MEWLYQKLWKQTFHVIGFLNLGHNTSTVKKTILTYSVNFKNGETIVPDDQNSKNIWWKPSSRRENSEKSSGMIGKIITIGIWQ